MDIAKMWYEKAAKQGYKPAISGLDEIYREIDPVEWKKRTCLVEDELKIENNIFEVSYFGTSGPSGKRPELTKEQGDQTRSRPKSYPAYWPYPAVVDDIETSVLGKYYCAGELGSSLNFSIFLSLPRCWYFVIRKLNSNSLEIALYDVGDKGIVEETDRRTLTKGTDYSVAGSALKVSSHTQGSMFGGYGFGLETEGSYLALTTNNCLLLKHIVVEVGFVIPMPIPGGASRSSWGLLRRVD